MASGHLNSSSRQQKEISSPPDNQDGKREREREREREAPVVHFLQLGQNLEHTSLWVTFHSMDAMSS
jgi:hypothetical protein